MADFRAERIYTYRQGRRVHYQVAGPVDAPPLLLLHGIGGSNNWWQSNMPEFSRFYRVYALDLPGFGQSWRLRGPTSIQALAAFVKDWLDHSDLPTVNLLGHSLGGQVAASFAAACPERVTKLILAAPSGLRVPLAERAAWAWRMPKVAVPLRQTLTVASGTLRTDALALGLSLRSILADRQLQATLATLTVPTLVLWGEADGVLPPGLGRQMAALIKKAPARLEYVERGTHNLMFDQAARFNHLVLDFLQEI